MSDYKDLEFLSERARELLDRQIASFRVSHAKAGTIIAVIVIFVPIFLFIIEKAAFIIQLFAIIPILVLGYALILMIEILRAQKLDQGFNEEQFDKLVNDSYENILLYEIGAKTSSIKDNQEITNKQNKRFNRGLNFTIISIFLSFLILIGSIFVNPKNNNNMTEKGKTESTNSETKKDSTSNTTKPKIRVIPTVSKKERIQLNEGIDPKTDKSKELSD